MLHLFFDMLLSYKYKVVFFALIWNFECFGWCCLINNIFESYFCVGWLAVTCFRNVHVLQHASNKFNEEAALTTTPHSKMIDDKEFNFVAQLSHVQFGLVTIFASYIWLPTHWYLFTLGLVVVYSAIKEFWYDEKYETTEVRGSSLEDFLFQAGGAIAASLLLFITKG